MKRIKRNFFGRWESDFKVQNLQISTLVKLCSLEYNFTSVQLLRNFWEVYRKCFPKSIFANISQQLFAVVLRHSARTRTRSISCSRNAVFKNWTNWIADAYQLTYDTLNISSVEILQMHIVQLLGQTKCFGCLSFFCVFHLNELMRS